MLVIQVYAVGLGYQFPSWARLHLYHIIKDRIMADKKKDQNRQSNKKQDAQKVSEAAEKNKNPEERKRRKEIVSTVVVVVVMLVLAAIGLWMLSGEGNKPSDKLAFTVGEEEVYLDEVNFCILQNVVNLGITTDMLNNTETKDGSSAAEYYKQEILELITDYKVEYMTAKQQGIALTEEEEKSVRSDAVQFMGSINGGVLKELGITQDMVIKVYKQRYLAKRLEDAVTAELEPEEQNYCTMYMMLFPKVEMEESGDYKRQEDGKTPIMLSEMDIDKRKQDADAAHQELIDGADIEEVAEKYGVVAYSGEESNLSGSFGEPFSEYAESLKEGEYSPVLETESCYAILKMVTENNEELAEQILGYYNADVAKDKVEEEKKQWYEEAGIEGPKFNGSVWEKVSLYDFTQYVEG